MTEFDPAHIDAAAATSVRLTFTNKSSLPHNLVFVGPITARTTDIVGPGATESFDLTPPGAGTFVFVCTIHEEMRGSLTVH